MGSKAFELCKAIVKWSITSCLKIEWALQLSFSFPFCCSCEIYLLALLQHNSQRRKTLRPFMLASQRKKACCKQLSVRLNKTI